jgi:hypothetical protein
MFVRQSYSEIKARATKELAETEKEIPRLVVGRERRTSGRVYLLYIGLPISLYVY